MKGNEICCPECMKYVKIADRKYDKQRDQNEPGRAWYHTTRWRRESDWHKTENPLCAECERQGRITPVYLTHHKIPHNGDYKLFWDQDNWESSCSEHHEIIHKKERWGR